MPFDLKGCFCGTGEERQDAVAEHPRLPLQGHASANGPTTEPAKPVSNGQSQQDPTASRSLVNTVDSNAVDSSSSAAVQSSLWGQAYRKLRETNDAVKQYEEILAPDHRSFTSEKDVQSMIQAQLQEREVKQWTLNVGSHSVKARKCCETVIKFLIWSKDVVAEAVSTQPYAAIAMAGVSVMLPLFTKAAEGTEDLMGGLEDICNLVRLYNLREHLYLGKYTTGHFQEALVELYADILLYQISTTIHFSHNIVVRAGLNILRPTEWKDHLAKIKKSDEECNRLADFIDKDREKRFQDEQEANLEKSVELQAAMLSMFREVQNVLEKQLDEQTRDRRDKLLGTFAFDYASNKDFVRNRVQGTCIWFLEDGTFLDWRSSDRSSMLLLTAGPGCGKSVLAKYLVDDHKVSPSMLTSTVCYTFFKQNQVSATDALRAVLHQILTSNREEDLISSASDAWRKFGDSLVSNPSELWNLLTSTLRNSSADTIVVVLDALDECSQDSREWLLDKLLDLIEERNKGTSSGTRLKILATTRPYVQISVKRDSLSRDVFNVNQEGAEQSQRMLTEINLVIEDWVYTELASSLKPTDRAIIVTKMQNKENRTYLWVSLACKLIKEKSRTKKTAKKLEPHLDAVPSDVYDAYDALLRDCPDVDLARRLFSLVLVAQRTLTILELGTACEILESDVNVYSDLDLSTEQQFHEIIANACRSMLTVVDGRVFLLHQTVAEYLLRPTNEDPSYTQSTERPVWHHAVMGANSHSAMAKSCMKLLHLKDFHELRNTSYYFPHFSKPIKLSAACETRYRDAFIENEPDDKIPEDEIPDNKMPLFRFPLYDYAANHWAEHYKEATTKTRQMLFSLALALCDARRPVFYNWRNTKHREQCLSSPLIAASLLGLFEVAIRTLSPFESTIDCRDGEGECDLAWESIPEHCKANRTSNGEFGTALGTASRLGYTSLVEALLSRGADPNIQVGYYTAPFVRACADGYLEIAQLLYSRGADLFPPQEAGGVDKTSALVVACKNNRKAVAHWLIKLDVPQHKANGTYAEALRNAVENCATDCVDLLVDPTKTGLKPSDYNDNGLASLIASRLYANSDAPRALHVIRALVEKGGADPNARVGKYHSPLKWACDIGYVHVVEYLLRNNANIDARIDTKTLVKEIELEDAFQISLLSDSSNGPAIRAALIEHSGPEIITKLDDKGNNRLHLMGKHLSFLSRIGLDDWDKRVPIFQCHVEACYWLFENGVDANALNNEGRTPGDVLSTWLPGLRVNNGAEKALLKFFETTSAKSGKILAPEKWVDKQQDSPLGDMTASVPTE
ncbi:hypothetical protein MMC10_003774 [Thelotrema lepadinum]|nr:hypothetical protein [Thelotrema lepadinum]